MHKDEDSSDFLTVPYLYWKLTPIVVTHKKESLDFSINEFKYLTVDYSLEEIRKFEQNLQNIKENCYEDCSLETETSSILQTMSTQVHYGKFCFSSLDLYQKEKFPSIVMIDEESIEEFIIKASKIELPIKFVLLKNKMSDSDIIDLFQKRKIHYVLDVSKNKDVYSLILNWHYEFLDEFNFYFWGRYNRFSDFIDLYQDVKFIDWYSSIMKEKDIQISSIFEKGGSFLCSLKNGDILCVKLYSEEEQDYLVGLDDFFDNLPQENQEDILKRKIIVDYKTEHSYVLEEKYLRYNFCKQFYTFEVGSKKYFAVLKKQTSFRV